MIEHVHAGQPLVTAGAAVGTGAAVAVMVHGRNASPEQILTLVPRLNRPAVSYVAPAAANGTWYPFTFLSDLSRNEPSLSSALDVLRALTDDLVARGVARRSIVLLGFSQGACLSAEFLARHPARWGGLVVLSGGLIGPPGTTWPVTGSLDGTPVFLGCSDVDAHIPKVRVEESASVFAALGADVTVRIYPGMGHTVNEDELEHARRILDQASTRR
jgi:predicted esterase